MASNIDEMIRRKSRRILKNLDRSDARLDEELCRRFRLQKKDARVILKTL